ncbi:hypothetical protein MHBO_002347 [Bonamia ostreae]|uniref:Uncharacterized protein n=1 Tax=Bonamia ostreae TaxID=126728 RepID=A0ABV2AM10_9EUKA
MSSKQNRKISGKRSFSSTSESSSPLKKKTKREKTRYRKLPKISKNSKNRTLPNRKFGKTTKSRSKGNFNSEKTTTEKKRNFKKEIDKKKKIDKVIDEKSSDKTITEKMPLEKKSHKVDSSKSEKKLDGVKNISLKEKLFIKPAKKIKSIKMSFKSSFPLKNAISSINKSNFKNPKTIKNENKNSQQKNFDGENSKLSQINNKSPIEKSDKTESKSRRKSENSNNGGWSTTKRPLRNFLQVKKMISTFNEELAEKIVFF